MALACRLRRLPLAGEQVLVLLANSALRVRARTDTCLHRRVTAYMRTCDASPVSVRPMGRSQTGERGQHHGIMFPLCAAPLQEVLTWVT